MPQKKAKASKKVPNKKHGFRSQDDLRAYIAFLNTTQRRLEAMLKAMEGVPVQQVWMLGQSQFERGSEIINDFCKNLTTAVEDAKYRPNPPKS